MVPIAGRTKTDTVHGGALWHTEASHSEATSSFMLRLAKVGGQGNHVGDEEAGNCG